MTACWKLNRVARTSGFLKGQSTQWSLRHFSARRERRAVDLCDEMVHLFLRACSTHSANQVESRNVFSGCRMIDGWLARCFALSVVSRDHISFPQAICSKPSLPLTDNPLFSRLSEQVVYLFSYFSRRVLVVIGNVTRSDVEIVSWIEVLKKTEAKPLKFSHSIELRGS